jgi:hypothetical protein
MNFNWVLLLYFQSKFAKTMHQSVFVNFLQMTMPMIDVNRVSGLTDTITKSVYGFHAFSM